MVSPLSLSLSLSLFIGCFALPFNHSILRRRTPFLFDFVEESNLFFLFCSNSFEGNPRLSCMIHPITFCVLFPCIFLSRSPSTLLCRPGNVNFVCLIERADFVLISFSSHILLHARVCEKTRLMLTSWCLWLYLSMRKSDYFCMHGLHAKLTLFSLITWCSWSKFSVKSPHFVHLMAVMTSCMTSVR